MKNKILLDSHVLLWLLKEPGFIGKQAAQAIRQAEVVYVSAASVWELHLKRYRGKLPGMPAITLHELERAGLTPLSVTCTHTEAVLTTPIPHKDPFDQLLLAQARVENAILLTSDRHLLTAQDTFDAQL